MNTCFFLIEGVVENLTASDAHLDNNRMGLLRKTEPCFLEFVALLRKIND